MSRRVRWGILGTARVNRVVVPLMHTLERHALVAVASRDSDRAAEYAAKWNIPHACGSYVELLDRDDVDAVYLSLPNSLHAEWTIRAIEAGKHVLCEKPIALTVESLDAIVDAARRQRVRVSEAYMYRHHAQTFRIQEIVAGGDLGQLRLVRGAFTYLLDRPSDIRWNPALGGGALWDVGCYPVGFALMCFRREPTDVVATAEWHVSGVDASCAGALTFGDDGTAIFDCGFRAAFRAPIEIVGTDAVLHVAAPFKPRARGELRIVRGGNETTVIVEGSDAYDGELDDMARQILDDEPAALPLEESRRMIATLVALERSARERRTVRLEDAT